MTDRVLKLPPEQQAFRDKCFHPSGTFVEFPKEEVEQSIPERFEKIVRLYPQRAAAKTRDHSFTYAALNQKANRIARAILERRGQGSEPIALLFEHGIEVIAAILGVLKASKFYVALDPSLPQKRNAYILEDSQAGLIVTNNRNVDRARALNNDARIVLNVDETDESFSADSPSLSVSADRLVAIRYTSGFTGEPRGVVETHENVLSSVRFRAHKMRTCPDDRLSLLHSVSFGSAYTHLFQSLLNGASLFPFDIKSEGIHRLARWLKEEQITIFHSSPAVFRQLADSLSGQERFPNLRLILLSGAAITQLDFDLYKKNFAPEASLEIGMGSTEARGICSAVVDHTFSFPKEGAPVGYPRQGNKIFLLDENGQEVGPNQVGEIAVKSRNLNPGYWRRPDLTSDKFLPDPSGGDERIYLTGDLGRILPDGFLIHLGRKDSQVKIRGYRIEIAEIERALLEHPQVKDAGVVAWDREPAEKYLVAYVVVRRDLAPMIDELRDFVRTKLPDYMMPSAFVFLESLPLTNGKLDRSALPMPNHKRPDLSHAYVQARNEIEEILLQLWEEILDLRPIGIHDNFFDLGGHSLAATRVVSQVIKRFQLELPLQSLFAAPTIAEMAAVIQAHRGKHLSEERLVRMLAELESMTEEEAQSLLDEESGKLNRGD